MILLPPYDHDQPFVSTTSMAGVAYHYNNYFNDTKQRWPTSTTTTVTTTTISNTKAMGWNPEKRVVKIYRHEYIY